MSETGEGKGLGWLVCMGAYCPDLGRGMWVSAAIRVVGCWVGGLQGCHCGWLVLTAFVAYLMIYGDVPLPWVVWRGMQA